MRKIAFLLIPALLCGIFCGCRPMVLVDGQAYQGLTKDEEMKLVALARASLKKSKKAVTPSELLQIQSNEPQRKIKYSGDCFGEARITWTLPTRRVTIIFKDAFFTPDMGWIFESEDLNEGVIDLTKNPINKNASVKTAAPGESGKDVSASQKKAKKK